MPAVYQRLSPHTLIPPTITGMLSQICACPQALVMFVPYSLSKTDSRPTVLWLYAVTVCGVTFSFWLLDICAIWLEKNSTIPPSGKRTSHIYRHELKTKTPPFLPQRKGSSMKRGRRRKKEEKKKEEKGRKEGGGGRFHCLAKPNDWFGFTRHFLFQ